MRALMQKCLAFINVHRIFLIYFALLAGVLLAWWAAFYPGVMTADSLDQWRQALSGDYNDAHPFVSTLFMDTFRWIKDTPAWVSLSQVIATSSLVAGFVSYAQRRGVSWKLCAAIIAIFMIWPVYGIYSVTIWKDILYSILVVTACLVTYLIIVDKRVARRQMPFIILAVLCAAIPLWRHNGLPYLLLPFIALLVVRMSQKKQILLSGGLALALFILIHFGVGSLLHVKQAPILVEWLRMKTVAAVYHEKHPTITADDRQLFASLMPEKDWQTAYRCFHTDTTFMQFYTYHPISFTDQVSTNPATEAAWKQAVNRTAFHNPTAVIKDHACVGKMLFSSQPGFIKYANDIFVRPDLPTVHEQPIAHTAGLKIKLKSWLQWSATAGVANAIFWSAIPALITVLLTLFVAIRNRAAATVILACLTLVNPLCVILIGSSSDYRYIYSLIITAPLLPLAYMAEQAKQRTKRLNVR